MNESMTRRNLLGALGGATVGAMMTSQAPRARAAENAPAATTAAPPKRAAKFTFCLNTATIRGQIQQQKLDIVKQAELTAEAGYSGIEPWMGHLHDYVKAGGSLADLKKRLADLNLRVESAIGFAQWIVDDDDRRAKGLEDAKRDMDVVAQIGGTRIAAPPAGATREGGLDLFKAAERYRALLEVGDEIGVVPMAEVWGFSANLSRLGETAFVMIESAHPKASMLPDVYHIFKGGSQFEGLNRLSPASIPVFHMNDYPAEPTREAMNDSHRVWPGDGVAPISDILRGLARGDSTIVLSLELFNRQYYQMDAQNCAKTGLAKMQAAVNKAMG